ncbi:Proline iminopeptidase [Termitomyces sp. J132]|nr:Proline iminopeptidase [Termitomyces sp. J132]
MLDDYIGLRPLKGAAQLLAKFSDWPPLYDEAQLAKNTVKVTAATYVDFNLAQITASAVQNMEQYISNQHHHSALRRETELILKKLFQLSKPVAPTSRTYAVSTSLHRYRSTVPPASSPRVRLHRCSSDECVLLNSRIYLERPSNSTGCESSSANNVLVPSFSSTYGSGDSGERARLITLFEPHPASRFRTLTPVSASLFADWGSDHSHLLPGYLEPPGAPLVHAPRGWCRLLASPAGTLAARSGLTMESSVPSAAPQECDAMSGLGYAGPRAAGSALRAMLLCPPCRTNSTEKNVTLSFVYIHVTTPDRSRPRTNPCKPNPSARHTSDEKKEHNPTRHRRARSEAEALFHLSQQLFYSRLARRHKVAARNLEQHWLLNSARVTYLPPRWQPTQTGPVSRAQHWRSRDLCCQATARCRQYRHSRSLGPPIYWNTPCLLHQPGLHAQAVVGTAAPTLQEARVPTADTG